MLTKLAIVVSLALIANGKKVKDHGFFVGRIPPSDLSPFYSLAYPELSGVMTPNDAMVLCEADFECSGFTYKGAKGVSQRFLIHFFRLLPPFAYLQALGASLDKMERCWTSYKVKRKFVLLPGTPNHASTTPIESEADMKLVNEIGKLLAIEDTAKRSKKASKVSVPPNLQAIGFDFTGHAHHIHYVDVKDFSLDFFQTKSLSILSTNLSFNVPKKCLFDGGHLPVDTSRIEEVSCFTWSNVFQTQFVMQNQAVLLKGCVETSPLKQMKIQDIYGLAELWHVVTKDGKRRKTNGKQLLEMDGHSLAVTSDIQPNAMKVLLDLEPTQSIGESVTIDLFKTVGLKTQPQRRIEVWPKDTGT